MFGKGTRDGRTGQEETEESAKTSRRSVLQALAAGAFAAPVATQMDEVAASSIDRPGGPVVLMGLDSEQGAGNPNNHGDPVDHTALIETILDETSNDGEGLVVLGASHSRGTEFWEDDIAPLLDAEMTLVDGVEGNEGYLDGDTISDVDFHEYAMVAVATIDTQLGNDPNGSGLTREENDVLVERRDELAEFVNDGGGLLGKSQAYRDREIDMWEYVDPIGDFELGRDGFSDIQVTDAGKDLGLTQDGMDHCCYHEVFTSYPDFLDVLITHDEGGTYHGEAAVVGGFEVVLLPEVNIEIEGPTAVEVGSTHDYEIELRNVGDDVEEENVDLELTIDREGGIEQGDLTLTYQGQEVDLTPENDALTGRLDEDINLVQDYNETFELEATFADEGIASRSFSIEAEAVGIGSEEDTYASGDITILTSWRVEVDAPIQTSPVYKDGIMYIGSDDGNLCAFDHDSGEEEWCIYLGDEIVGSPTFSDDYLYVGSTNGRLYRLDLDPDIDDRIDWELELDAGIYSSPNIVYGNLYIATDGGDLYALDPDTGDIEWELELDGGVRSSPTVTGGDLFIGDDEGLIYGIDAITGDIEWTYETDDRVRSSPTYGDAIVSDGIVVVGSDDGTLYGLNAGDGTLRWSSSTDDAVEASPTIADGVVVVGSNDGNLYAFDVDDGEEVWKYDEPEGSVRSSPVIGGDRAHFGADDGLVYAVTIDRGLLVWAFDIGDEIGASSPTIAGGNLYIGTSEGGVFGVDAGYDEDESGRGSRSKLGTIGGHDEPAPQPLLQMDLLDVTATPTDDSLECTIYAENIGDAPATRDVDLKLVSDDGETRQLETLEVEVEPGTETTQTLESQDVGYPDDSENWTIVVDGEGDDSIESALPNHLAEFTLESIDQAASPLTDEPVVIEGQPLEVTAEIKNDGDTDGTQPIRLTTADDRKDSQDLTLDTDHTGDVDLTWETGAAGEYTVTIGSFDDADTLDVSVLTPAEATGLLSEHVAEVDLSGGRGPERSLQQILDAATRAFEQDNEHPAVNQLYSFVTRVEAAERAGHISDEEVKTALDGAAWILEAVESDR